MKKVYKTLNLPEGNKVVEVIIYEQDDMPKLGAIYNGWRVLCDDLNALQARSVNLPEGLSEISFSIAKKMWRTPGKIDGAKSSFDCYDPQGQKNNNRIQVKASSVEEDLTSFGPKTEWDRIYFMDFYREGAWDGSFDIYEIDTEEILNFPVNKKETFQEQQKQGRRPRFSIKKDLILQGKYIRKETYKITKEAIVEMKDS